ncbi:MAG: septum formation initiator family protein [Clostridia bacterium]|nr:septum formation initiator family protein [Clostridia bacterium]
MANLYGYNTSSAYKLGGTDSRYGQNLHREIHKENKRVAKPVAKAKNGLANLVLVAMFFVMAFAVVSGYVAINEANNEISSLKSEYNEIVASNQAIQVKIDKAIDLNKLQSVAGERFGMVRPERYQMFYVDLQMGDFSEKTSDKVESEKSQKIANMGVPGVITGALNIFR